MKSCPSGALAEGSKNICVTIALLMVDSGVLTRRASKRVDGAGEGDEGPGVASGSGDGETVGAGDGVAVALGSGSARNCPWTRGWISIRTEPPAAKNPSPIGASAANSELLPPTIQLLGRGGIVPSSAIGYASMRSEPRPAT